MIDLIKEYASKRADLLQLEATEKSVTILGTVIYIILILFSALFFIQLFLFGLAFLIGSYLNNYGYGLLIVAGLFLIALTFSILAFICSFACIYLFTFAR